MSKDFDFTNLDNLIDPETERKYPEEVKLVRSVWPKISKEKIEMVMRAAELEPNRKKTSPNEPPEWVQTIRRLKAEVDADKTGELIKLPDHLEKHLSKDIQLIRKFYFSLSEEEKRKIFDEQPQKDESKPYKSKENKYCYECGKIINRSANFCEHCGNKQPKIT